MLDEGGPDKAKRDAVRSGLARRRLTNGYVTAESSDWYLVGLASEVRKSGKPMDMQALGRLYATWHVEAANFSEALLRQVTGRQAAQVLLLHETDLAAFYLADLIRALRAHGWTLISADQAYADPLGREFPDTPSANGTLSEALAWQKGSLRRAGTPTTTPGSPSNASILKCWENHSAIDRALQLYLTPVRYRESGKKVHRPPNGPRCLGPIAPE